MVARICKQIGLILCFFRLSVVMLVQSPAETHLHKPKVVWKRREVNTVTSRTK